MQGAIRNLVKHFRDWAERVDTVAAAMEEGPMNTEVNDEDAQIFSAIVNGIRHPNPEAFQQGRDDHEARKEFHEGPKPDNTSWALSWRMGWNNRALQVLE